MLVGCLPLTSLLQSSLLCFYQQDCLHRIHQTLNLDLIAPNLILTTLDNTTESRFKPDSTLDNIINSLFVETWTSQANYSSYFHECAVKTCTYSRFQNDNVLVFITKFISFCKFLILLEIKFQIFSFHRWWYDSGSTIFSSFIDQY